MRANKVEFVGPCYCIETDYKDENPKWTDEHVYYRIGSTWYEAMGSSLEPIWDDEREALLDKIIKEHFNS